ncbi:MAG: nucleotidyltransferase domain-containing protein [Treponema sp.]|jgi:predicted nucleotidyltransferase|nr:nucleotidyltransferase domain-containing protein [Treponema sp.]
MEKIATTVRKKNSPKAQTSRKRATPPFADKITFIRSLILDSVKPETIKKIYLFGSYAYGKPTKRSDIDLCVIIGDNFLESKTDINLQIALNLFDNEIIPADVLVYTEKQFHEINNPNGIKNTIMTKGKLLYE